jgi:hypothetical protein
MLNSKFFHGKNELARLFAQGILFAAGILFAHTVRNSERERGGDTINMVSDNKMDMIHTPAFKKKMLALSFLNATS